MWAAHIALYGNSFSVACSYATVYKQSGAILSRQCQQGIAPDYQVAFHRKGYFFMAANTRSG